MKRMFRAAQVYFPFIRPVKFSIRNTATRLLGSPMDVEFRLLERMAPTDLVLDIGANWGQSIAAIMRTAKPERIVSFEPNRSLADWLARAHTGDPSIEIENCALGDEIGRFNLFIPRYRQYVFDGLASLDREEAANWLNGERMAFFDPQKISVEEQPVSVKLLDSYGFYPDIVKIDVQGAEHKVVRGGIETFKRSQPVSIVEEPSQALVELFASIGMTAYQFDGEQLTERWQGLKNVVFLSDDRRKALGL